MRGEAVVTSDGLEGGAIYALSAPLRDAIEQDGEAILSVDLRPDISLQSLINRLAIPRKGQSTSTFLRKAAGLSPLDIALLREGEIALPTDPEGLAALIKAAPLRLTGLKPLDRAISTAGGVPFAELDEHLMLRRSPGCSWRGKCSTGRRRPAAISCRRRSSTAMAAAEGVLAYPAGAPIPDAALTESGPSATPEP